MRSCIPPMPCVSTYGLTIGIVEPDDSVRKALDRLFRSEGWTVCVFSEADTAGIATACHDARITCLVVDLASTMVANTERLEAFRDSVGTCPIIAISTQEDASTLERARRICSSAFFRKPVDDQALLDAVRWAVTMRS